MINKEKKDLEILLWSIFTSTYFCVLFYYGYKTVLVLLLTFHLSMASFTIITLLRKIDKK